MGSLLALLLPSMDCSSTITLDSLCAFLTIWNSFWMRTSFSCIALTYRGHRPSELSKTCSCSDCAGLKRRVTHTAKLLHLISTVAYRTFPSLLSHLLLHLHSDFSESERRERPGAWATMSEGQQPSAALETLPLNLFSLPTEILRLIPQHLPWQSTLRFLATCKYLCHLFSPEELATFRSRDASEMYKMEQDLWAKLPLGPDWAFSRTWHDERFGLIELPCYICLKWLDFDQWYTLLAWNQ